LYLYLRLRVVSRPIFFPCTPLFRSRVSRGQMAAFLVRALGLPAAANRFVDDDGSVFEGDIGALAAAGITRGCNPPANDEFCPDQDRKSTRLNSSHVKISYAVYCLKK